MIFSARAPAPLTAPAGAGIGGPAEMETATLVADETAVILASSTDVKVTAPELANTPPFVAS